MATTICAKQPRTCASTSTSATSTRVYHDVHGRGLRPDLRRRRFQHPADRSVRNGNERRLGPGVSRAFDGATPRSNGSPAVFLLPRGRKQCLRVQGLGVGAAASAVGTDVSNGLQQVEPKRMQYLAKWSMHSTSGGRWRSALVGAVRGRTQRWPPSRTPSPTLRRRTLTQGTGKRSAPVRRSSTEGAWAGLPELLARLQEWWVQLSRFAQRGARSRDRGQLQSA